MTLPVSIAVLTIPLALLPAPATTVAAAPSALERPGRAVVVPNHLRPQSSRTAMWVREAKVRSATVRRLIERIEASDVLVYIDAPPRLTPGVAACLTWMATTPAVRIVRASFRPDLRTTEAIAMLAHELQHVVEVAEHPEVQDEGTLLALYTRIGHPTAASGRHWDTADALALGALARSEAARDLRPARTPAATAGRS